MTRRKKLIVLGAAAGLVIAVTAMNVLPSRAANTAAHDAAERYVDYVASGDEDDLEPLWAMTVSESPGALRSAGELLVAAEERIEVVSVGVPQETPQADVPYQANLEDFVEVDVRYRLDGEDRTAPVVLGRLVEESGTDVGDWRVVEGLTGSIGWEHPGLTPGLGDLYLGSTRLVRRPQSISSTERVQPLYPAVYAAQLRLDPYFASEPTMVTVTAGEPVGQPTLSADPTPRTEKMVRRDVRDWFDHCAPGSGEEWLCPLRDLAERAGVEPWTDRGWWLGLSQAPAVTFGDGGTITLTGGEFRFRGPGGVRKLGFNGTGRYVLDNQSWTPRVVSIDLTEAG